MLLSGQPYLKNAKRIRFLRNDLQGWFSPYSHSEGIFNIPKYAQ